MTIFGINIKWNSVEIASKISDLFQKKGLTNQKGDYYNTSIGFSDDGNKSAMLIEGFDLKNHWGIKVAIPNYKREIWIIGGLFSDDRLMKSEFNMEFTNLSKASDFIEFVLSKYEALKK